VAAAFCSVYLEGYKFRELLIGVKTIVFMAIIAKKKCRKCGELFPVGHTIPLSHYKTCGKSS